MIAVLDILQSIPVLSFLPPVVLAMVALVPGHQLGIEMGVILLIFTGQVWNLAFSFYSSLKSIPREMLEASRIYRYSAWQRFWQLEMPNAAIGLVRGPRVKPGVPRPVSEDQAFGLIEEALAPLNDTLGGTDPARLTQLKQDLAAVVSAEALFSLTDLARLTSEDAIASLVRTATTVTAATLGPGATT